MIHRSEIEEAAIIISRVTAFYNAAILKRALTTAFYNTRNLDSYITIVRHVYENHERREALVNELEESRIDTMGDKEDVVGMLVLDLAGKARQFAEVAQDVFGALVEQGTLLQQNFKYLSIHRKQLRILMQKVKQTFFVNFVFHIVFFNNRRVGVIYN